jgi:hypothetical protein
MRTINWAGNGFLGEQVLKGIIKWTSYPSTDELVTTGF